MKPIVFADGQIKATGAFPTGDGPSDIRIPDLKPDGSHGMRSDHRYFAECVARERAWRESWRSRMHHALWLIEGGSR